MRVLLTLFMLVLAFPGLASAACSYKFEGADGVDYVSSKLSDFVENKMRKKLEGTSTAKYYTVKIKRDCDGAKTEVPLKIRTYDLYITEIGGASLPSNISTYTNDALTISYAEFENKYADALGFSGLTTTKKQMVLKMLAFIVSETARFAQIDEVATDIFARHNCSYKWTDFSNLVRHWKLISNYRHYINTSSGTISYTGGAGADLYAPILKSMVDAYNTDAAKTTSANKVVIKNYWEPDVRTTDPKAPVTVGAATCTN